MNAELTAGLTVRRYESEDEGAVLRLVNADRLPGQPEVTADMLAEAMAGRSAVDSGWWAKLRLPCTDVAVDGAGRVVGVVSCAVSREDGTGFLLWLHCGESEAVVPVLVAHACATLGERPMRAFDFASALTMGMEALPVRHRPVTHAALLDAGFTGEPLWRYMRLPLRGRELPLRGRAVVSKREDGMYDLVLRRRFRKVAEAVVGAPRAGVGVLWWISVRTRARGRGLGRKLLGEALGLLAEMGADEVILYVDDGASAMADRTAANALYDSAGFAEVDRLWFYSRQPGA